MSVVAVGQSLLLALGQAVGRAELGLLGRRLGLDVQVVHDGRSNVVLERVSQHLVKGLSSN